MVEPEEQTDLSPARENLDQESPIDRVPSADVIEDAIVDVVADATAADTIALDAPAVNPAPSDTATDPATDIEEKTRGSKQSPDKPKRKLVPPILGFRADGGGDAAPLSARSAQGRMDELASFAEELPIASRNKADVDKRKEYFNRLRGKNMKLSLARLENIKAQEMVDLPSLVLRKSFFFAKMATPQKDVSTIMSTREPRGAVPGEEDLSFEEFRFMLMFIQEFIRVQVALDVADVSQIMELASAKQKLLDRNYADAVAFMESHKEISEALSFERVAQYAVKRRLDARVEKIIASKSASKKGPALVQTAAQRLEVGDTVKPTPRKPANTFARSTPNLPPATKNTTLAAPPTSRSFIPGSRLGPSRSGSNAGLAKKTNGVTPKTAAGVTRPPTSATMMKAKAAPPKVAAANKIAVKAHMPGSAAPGMPKSKMKPAGKALAKAKASLAKGGAKAPSAKAKSGSGPFAPPARASEQVSWDILAKLPKRRESQKKLFAQFDPNATGVLGLNDIQQGLTKMSPTELDAQITTRAYQAAKGRGPCAEDAVSETEFPMLLAYLRHYAELRVLFPRTAANESNGMNSEEFLDAQEKIASWGAEVEDPAQAFATIDSDGKGSILFNDFCDWAIKVKLDSLRKSNAGDRISQASGNALKETSREETVEEGSKRPSQGSSSKISRSSAAKLSQGSAAKLSKGSAAKLSQGSAAKLSQGSAAKLSQGSAAKLSQGSAAKLSQGFATKLSQDSAAKLSKGSAAKLSQNSAAKLSQGSAAKLSQGSAAKLCEGSAEKLSRGSAVKFSQDSGAKTSLRSEGSGTNIEQEPGLEGDENDETQKKSSQMSEKIEKKTSQMSEGSAKISQGSAAKISLRSEGSGAIIAQEPDLDGDENDKQKKGSQMSEGSAKISQVSGGSLKKSSESFEGISKKTLEVSNGTPKENSQSSAKGEVSPVLPETCGFDDDAVDEVSPTNQSANWGIDDPDDRHTTKSGTREDEGASARTSGMTGDQSVQSGNTGSGSMRKRRKHKTKQSEKGEAPSPEY